ncbi:rRNA-processing protein UTP23 homolog [Chenopodium quinoa]|uniref:rRNA-processing protein UTP23 homolog n=1 Tax=Chenopodium quinoa TaxID=63459 RepID=UPI000B78D988|nr:rRNA-processing protein UTP23 homolog [Chenopodium quinoa]
MRFKKQKRHRKTVRFYTACFGFREPFKVLCHGTFVHHLVSNHLSPETTVSNTLAASVQLFTTKCVIEELKSLGKSHVESYRVARRDYKLARCEHGEQESALNCIVEVIGENNPEHFFVATQDIELRNKCRKVPGLPVMFGLRNAIFLEQLSSYQREFVKAAEEERLHMTDSEYKLLQKRIKGILNTKELKDPAEEGTDDEDLLGQPVVSRVPSKTDAIHARDKAQFKKKRAKGPNPLSCKNKKTISSSGPSAGNADKTDSDTKRSRPRKRKRSRKANTSSDTV